MVWCVSTWVNHCAVVSVVCVTQASHDAVQLVAVCDSSAWQSAGGSLILSQMLVEMPAEALQAEYSGWSIARCIRCAQGWQQQVPQGPAYLDLTDKANCNMHTSATAVSKQAPSNHQQAIERQS